MDLEAKQREMRERLRRQQLRIAEKPRGSEPRKAVIRPPKPPREPRPKPTPVSVHAIVERALEAKHGKNCVWIRHLFKCDLIYSLRSGETYHCTYTLGMHDAVNFSPAALVKENRFDNLVQRLERESRGIKWSAYGVANGDPVSPIQSSIPKWGEKIKLRTKRVNTGNPME